MTKKELISAADMSAILGKIKERGLLQSITRYQYLPVDMETALGIVESIGGARNPKFQIDDENRFTYENLIRWAHCDIEMKCLDAETKRIVPGRLKSGIYIAGNTGSGKSWALEIMAAYAMVYDFRIQMEETQRSLYWKNFRTDIICDEYVTSGIVEKYKKMLILGIQDLGAEPAESLYMGNRVNVMRQILEYRGDRSDQITLITSNLPLNHKQLIDRYDDRVSSRLNEMCNYFEIKGKDRRRR
jgi:chromosomal replication initiation ATPase DnaA